MGDVGIRYVVQTIIHDSSNDDEFHNPPPGFESCYSLHCNKAHSDALNEHKNMIRVHKLPLGYVRYGMGIKEIQFSVMKPLADVDKWDPVYL